MIQSSNHSSTTQANLGYSIIIPYTHCKRFLRFKKAVFQKEGCKFQMNLLTSWTPLFEAHTHWDSSDRLHRSHIKQYCCVAFRVCRGYPAVTALHGTSCRSSLSLHSQLRGGGGGVGTHMLRHTGMCCPNGWLFHQKSLDMGPILVKKILRSLNQKISCFWGRKILRNRSWFAKILRKKKPV